MKRFGQIAEVVLIMTLPVALHFGLQFLIAIALRIFPSVAESMMAIPILMVGSLGITILLLVGLPKLLTKVKNRRIRKIGEVTKTDADELGVKELPSWMDVGLAPLALVLSLILGVVVAAMVSLIPGVDMTQKQELGLKFGMSGMERALMFLTMAVMVPLGEEIIYRGWIYGKLRARIRGVIAAVLTSLLFAVAHGQLNVMAAVLPVGVLAALMREFTGTIWAGVLLHMLKNGLAFYILMLTGAF